MRSAIFAACAVLLALAAAHAQPAPGDKTAPTDGAASIAGVDEAALARSARARKIIGSKVYNGDTSIGHIEDVLVDLERASLTAVILSVGGFLGVGDKLVAVPPGQVKVGSEARFTTELTKDQLANAPAFDIAKLK